MVEIFDSSENAKTEGEGSFDLDQEEQELLINGDLNDLLNREISKVP